MSKICCLNWIIFDVGVCIFDYCPLETKLILWFGFSYFDVAKFVSCKVIATKSQNNCHRKKEELLLFCVVMLKRNWTTEIFVYKKFNVSLLFKIEFAVMGIRETFEIICLQLWNKPNLVNIRNVTYIYANIDFQRLCAP
jgi:hypothetical protein